MSAREKFKLLKFLGSGGFAQTHYAEVLDEVLRSKWGPAVAIKIPLSKEKEQALINEIITNASLHFNLQGLHDLNIVRYLGFETYDGWYVMVMEYVEGGDLRRRVGDIGCQRPLPVAEAMEITLQVCRGLVKIHQFNIFHRDLKPENILISEKDHQAKITDFGIGRIMTSSQLASTTTGTIFYMPRELLRGKGGHFYSDIYSLGVTSYEMLTGQVPFRGDNLVEIIDNISQGAVAPPHEVNPQVDEELAGIIMKAMARDPRQRYKTAADFLKVLENYRSLRHPHTDELAESLEDIRLLREQHGLGPAVRRAEALLREHPEEERLYLALGDLHCGGFLYSKAVAVLKGGIKLLPDSALLHRNLGLALQQQGALPEARRELLEALRLAPDKKFETKINLLLRALQLKIGSVRTQ
jgi:serine/threonine protein kinase